MIKGCNEYYMIDAIVNGNVIRKRKYRKEMTMITSKWYDYNEQEITDPGELARVESLATKHARVDAFYDDYAVFMNSVNYVTSLEALPMDKHMIVVEWTPEEDQGFLSMKFPESFEGDSYYVVVINTGTKTSTIYAPQNEESKDEVRAEDLYVNIGGSYVSMSPKSVERARVTFRNGKWYWEMYPKPSVSTGGGVQIGDVDYLVFRYLWESSSGKDLDTMTELVNSNIPGVDNQGVGFNGPGNGDSVVSSILKWGGDNTGSGKECVWMSVKELKDKYGDVLPIETFFMAYATWFGERGDGKCSFELRAYKGGTMSQDGYNFVNTGGETVYQNTHDFICDTRQGSSDYKNQYAQVAKIVFNKTTNSVYMYVGGDIDEEDRYEQLELSIEDILKRLSSVEKSILGINDTIEGLSEGLSTLDEAVKSNTKSIENLVSEVGDLGDSIDAVDEKLNGTIKDLSGFKEQTNDLIEQALYVTLDHVPTSSDLSYTKGDRTIDFVPGAIVRYVYPDTGDFVFYKLVEVSEDVADWCVLVDSRFGDVNLETVYDKNYEVVNIVSGSRLTGIKSLSEDIKFVNSAVGNVTIVFNFSVSAGVSSLDSMLKANEVVLTPGSAASFTKTGGKYMLTELFGVTIFPDLIDSGRAGTWAMTVSPAGKPVLMEVVDIRKWDESIVKEMTIDELNEKFPDVQVGFTVVCKTIGKAYEMVNGYKEWVSYDIRFLN